MRPADEASSIERAIALERSMARVRWFGVALGYYLVWSYYLVPDPTLGPRVTPGWLDPAAYGIITAILAVNVAVAAVLRRPPTSLGFWRRFSLGVFIADCALLFGLVWLYSFERNSTTWVILYILGLEGALRFQLAGALAPVLAALPLEIVRDVFRFQEFGYPFYISSPVYRVGIMAIVAAVAGIMARNLERERANAQATATSERGAREESDAFHQVVLAGLEGGNLDETMSRVVEAMATALGYEAFAIALVEHTLDGDFIRCIGASGFPPSSVGRTLPLSEGISGAAVRSGQPLLVNDTSVDSRYVDWLPGTRSEMCVPISHGGQVIGLVDVESPIMDRFDQGDLDRLVRLAPQIGLVIMNARLLEQERAAVQRLRELDQMKSDFVAITSHELRTPLTSIRGFVRTLARPEAQSDPAETGQYLSIIDRQTERLTRLVEDLLVVSRIESGQVRFERESVRVDEMLLHVVEEIGPAGDRVSVSVEDGLPTLTTDGQRLTQVIRNLIDNGLKFSPSGSPITINARLGDGEVIIDVADRGVGIPEEELERIFDRFYQIGGSMGRRAQGAGLGLYIARWITETLGGRIAVASDPGAGTTFTVSLPTEAVEQQVVQRTG